MLTIANRLTTKVRKLSFCIYIYLVISLPVSGINQDIGISVGKKYEYSSVESSQRGLFNESRAIETVIQKLNRTISSINGTSKSVEVIVPSSAGNPPTVHQYKLDDWTSPFIFTDWAYWIDYAQNLTSETHSLYKNVTIQEDEGFLTITRHSQSFSILIGNPTQWMNTSSDDTTMYHQTTGVRIKYEKNSWIHYQNGSYKEFDYVEDLIQPNYYTTETTNISSSSIIKESSQSTRSSDVSKTNTSEDKKLNFISIDQIVSIGLSILIITRKKTNH